MMPDATMVKITMKSILAALVINNQHNPTHKSRMQIKRIIFPVVITLFTVCLNCKGSHIL